MGHDPTVAITAIIRGELGRELASLGVRTAGDLALRGWKSVFEELTSANPRRLNTSSALSLCAAELGKRPIEVPESRLDAVGVFVGTLKARREAERTEAPPTRTPKPKSPTAKPRATKPARGR